MSEAEKLSAELSKPLALRRHIDVAATLLRKQDAALQQALDNLDSIRRYGLDTLSGRSEGPDDRAWQRAAVNEMTKRARLAIAAIRKQNP